MWQIALEVLDIALAILGMVQHGVDIVEDIPFAHTLPIPLLELLQCPVGDIFAPVAAILGVGVVGKALSARTSSYQMQVWYNVGC